MTEAIITIIIAIKGGLERHEHYRDRTMSISTRIAELARHKGINNNIQLGELLGVHRQTVGRLINRQHATRLELATIEKLCRGFNIMPNDLFVITNEDGSLWAPERY